MFIDPMQKIDGIGGSLPIGSGTAAGQKANGIFKGLFDQSIASVAETEALVAADTLALAAGDVDDLHTLGIHQTQAQLSVSMLVQLRNRFLESYNELMRISL